MKVFEFPIRCFLVMVALTTCDHHIRAQNLTDQAPIENHSPFDQSHTDNHSPSHAVVPQWLSVGGEYLTEWQTDFRGAYNWANLLRLSADIKMSNSFSFQAATLSISQTDPNPIVDDLQGFSNIAEDNCALTLAMLGFGWQNDRSQFFIGIRNVNEDYFTTPFTSLFTNSSCGIYPTLSHNYEIANYPLSSWSVHFAQAWEQLTLNLSVYNGRGYQRFTDHDNMFRLSPKNDGVFTITSITHQKNDSHYTFGLAAFYGVHTPEMGGDDYTLTQGLKESALLKLGFIPAFEGKAFKEGTLSACSDPQSALGALQAFKEGAIDEEDSHGQPIPRKKLSFAPWINVEQTLADGWQLMAQASMSTYRHGCRYFAGAGLKYTISDIDIALYGDYAHYADDNEVASELTCRIPISTKSYIQPSIHLIATNSHTRCVSLLRFGFEF